jgi:hydroxymethylpyrimidine/phosphomethylpyrimidine kinase
MKKVLTIAGSDSGGGAGIQADLKAFSARGVFGMSAITALTAQNTVGVQGVFEIDPEFVAMQIDSIMTDIGTDAIKVGMLSNSKIIRVVAEKVKQYHIKNLIVDPVMIAKSGDLLLKEDAIETLIKQLIPLAYLITPNIHEAKALSKIDIKSVKDMKKASKDLHKMGCKNVLIKGGNLDFSDYAIDVLYDGRNFTEFKVKRISTKNTHGTGCTYASAIAAEIAKNISLTKAIQIAKSYLTTAIKLSDRLSVGKGYGPVDHFQENIVEVDMSLVEVSKNF